MATDKGGEDLKMDEDKIDDAAIAILGLTLHDERRVWKTIDWAITQRLWEKGLISDPTGKSKSILLTDKGMTLARAKLSELFGQSCKTG